MVNTILASRGARHVGKQWSYRFVKRRPELKTRFSRAYDFQRALCENSDAMIAWFQLVLNMRNKYGILDCDFYNFDETGFMMGQICPGMVVTHSDRRGRGKVVQPGNRNGRPQSFAPVATGSTCLLFCSCKVSITWPIGTLKAVSPTHGSLSLLPKGGRTTRQA